MSLDAPDGGAPTRREVHVYAAGGGQSTRPQRTGTGARSDSLRGIVGLKMAPRVAVDALYLLPGRGSGALDGDEEGSKGTAPGNGGDSGECAPRGGHEITKLHV